MRESRPTRQSQGRPDVDHKPMHRQLGYGGLNDYLHNQGYHLYWARYTTDGKDDSSDISDRLAQGYTPVNASDLPADMAASIQTKDEGRMTGAVVRRDVMAMKIPLEDYNEIMRQNLERAERQVMTLPNEREKLQRQLASPHSRSLAANEVAKDVGVTETIGTKELERQLRF